MLRYLLYECEQERVPFEKEVADNECDSEYVFYHTTDKKIMSNQSLKVLEEVLPKTAFLRVHRSYIVDKDFVTGLKGRDFLLSEDVIPVSDSYYDAVKLDLF